MAFITIDLIIIFLILVALIVGYFMISKQGKRIVTTDVFLEKIERVAKIATYEVFISEIIDVPCIDKKGNIDTSKDRIGILTVEARVIVCFDLAKMEKTPRGNKLILNKIPAPELKYVDFKSNVIITSGKRRHRKGSDLLHTQMNILAKETIQNKAIDDNIYVDAMEHFTKSLNNFSKVLGWQLEASKSAFQLPERRDLTEDVRKQMLLLDN